MDIRYREFPQLNTSEQIRFLKEGEFREFSRGQKIEFLKYILQPDLSSKTTACALKILRELNYEDKYFFKKFIYHVDSSVANAAKKAMEETHEKKSKPRSGTVRQLAKEKGENKVAFIKTLFREKKRISDTLLLSLLASDEVRVRETVIKEASNLEKLNEGKLIESIKHSVWYVRSALVEILGNRKSRLLFEVMDQLLADQNAEVKLKLIDALSALDRNEVKEYLQRLSHDPLIFVRKEAERVLSNI